jgi:Spy/CpxP family protein refolding chaperone
MENSMTKRNSMQHALVSLAIPAALLMLSVPAQADPFQSGGNGGQPVGAPPQATGHIQAEGPDQPGGGSHRPPLMQQLGLSQEQSQKLKALMQQGRTQSQALHQQLRTKRQALMQYLQSPDATESNARALNGEINDIQRQLSELRLKTWFGMRAQMTPEQLQKLDRMKGQLGGGRGGPGGGERRFGGPNGSGGGHGHGDCGPIGPSAGFMPPRDNPAAYGQPADSPRIGSARPIGPDVDSWNGAFPDDGPPPPDGQEEGPAPNP